MSLKMFDGKREVFAPPVIGRKRADGSAKYDSLLPVDNATGYTIDFQLIRTPAIRLKLGYDTVFTFDPSTDVAEIQELEDGVIGTIVFNKEHQQQTLSFSAKATKDQVAELKEALHIK